MGRLLDIGTVKGKDAFVVERVVGKEELSQLFEYRIDLLSERDDHTAKDILGTNASLSIERPGGGETIYRNGYVSRFSVLGQVRTPAFKSNVGFRYQMVLSPWIWFMTRTSTCAIFQQKKMLDVAVEVLGRQSALKSLENKVSGTTEMRDYCVQYRETDFHFFSRLMEQEGLYYYFTHENGKHTLVLADSPGVHQPLPGRSELRFSAGTLYDASLKTWAQNAEIQPGAYAIDDRDYNKPNTPLLKVASKEREHKNAGFELYDYPGEYEDPGSGDRYSKIRIEELHCQHELSRGSGTERGILPGFKFKLVDHPVASLNKEYLVVAHSFVGDNNLANSGTAGMGEGATFECNFSCIPAATQFRPPRLTPLPSIAGPQTATVVGPQGEEIHTDKLGRVKLQFHWDRYSKGTDSDSCWVRVTNSIAGKGWGALNIPRIGHEVIVDFLEGDPDRPIIVGRVYNGENQTPYDLPSKKMVTGMKTRSYPDGSNDEFNELRFDDTKGSEQVFLQAQKWYDIRVKNTLKEWIGGTYNTFSCGSIFQKTDKDLHQLVKGDISITAKEGLIDLQAKQDIKLDTKTTLFMQASEAITEKADTVYLNGASQIHLKGKQIFLTGELGIDLKVGGNFVSINSAGVFIKGSLVNINSGGSAQAAEPVDAFVPAETKSPAIALTSVGGAKSEPPKARTKPKAYSGQASAFKVAAGSGGPFVKPCEC